MAREEEPAWLSTLEEEEAVGNRESWPKMCVGGERGRSREEMQEEIDL